MSRTNYKVNYAKRRLVRGTLRSRRRHMIKLKRQEKSSHVGNLRSRFQDMGAEEAIALLEGVFNFGSGMIEWPNGRQTTVSGLRSDVAEANVLACEVGPLKFWGGPPQPKNSPRMFTGSLLTFLLERILYEWAYYDDNTWIAA
jgi:hypothetical protein